MPKVECASVFWSPPKNFQRWLNDPSAAPPDNPDIVMFGTREHRQGRNLVDRDELRTELTSNRSSDMSLVITSIQPNNQPEIGNLLCFLDLNEKMIYLNSLIFECDNRSKENCTISNMAIRNLRFSGSMRSWIIIRNCWIEKMTVQKGIINMEIIDSHIAYLDIRQGSWDKLTIRNSSLASLRLHDSNKPLVVGNARIANLLTPRGASWYKKGNQEADQWAQAKQDLSHIGNVWAAGVFHATEMSIRSQEDVSKIVRGIGQFYGDVCDYGNSITRPFIWLLVWFFLSWLAYFVFDLVSSSVILEAKSCVGWVKGLCGDGPWARLWRTLYLSAQPMLNPLAGITGASVVVPGPAAYVYSIFHRVLSIVLIFLLLVAVRRRFRLGRGA